VVAARTPCLNGFGGGASLAPKCSSAFAEPTISSAQRHVLLDRRVHHCGGPALFCLGASLPRKQLDQEVTVKQGHELMTSGPYALVRHPIYTGLLLAFLGSAVARGEWRGLLAVALVFGMLWSKLRLEEKWMGAQFGESYEAYSRRVSALVPYII
jgi:Phospholipid methyltransferase